MTKPSVLACLGLAACAAPAVDDTQSAISPTPPARLSVKRDQILDPSGAPFLQRGWHWGQWGTAEPTDATDNLAQGANSVRIPLRWWGDWKDGVDSRVADAPYIDPDHFTLLKQTVKQATDAHLWVTIFIDSNDGQGAADETNGYTNFWTSPDDKAQFITAWKAVVKEFRSYPYIAAYEILPEPRPKHLVKGVETAFTNADVKDFYDSIIPTIRGLDPTTPIVVGPNEAYNPKDLEDTRTSFSNIIYTADYFIFDQSDELNRIGYLQDFLAPGTDPLWINQVGIRSSYSDPFNRADNVLTQFANLGIGWAWWTYREDTTSPDEHGIFYRNADNSWHEKVHWYDFVGAHF